MQKRNKLKMWPKHFAFGGTTILDINFCTNAKCGQKVLFRESAKSAYFRSAS